MREWPDDGLKPKSFRAVEQFVSNYIVQSHLVLHFEGEFNSFVASGDSLIGDVGLRRR